MKEKNLKEKERVVLEKLVQDNKNEIKKELLSKKPDCVVAICPRHWMAFLLRNLPKSTVWLIPRFKAIHVGEEKKEPCEEFDGKQDVIINPSNARYKNYITRGDKVVHLRHSGFDRMILTQNQMIVINWTGRKDKKERI